MKKGESMQQTVKWILVLLIAIKVGTFVMERLYDLHINVWLARGAGAVATALCALPMQRCLEKKSRHTKSVI